MRKGWYFRYLSYKVMEYQRLVENSQTEEEVKTNQEQMDLYLLLFIDKFNSRGTIEENEVSTEEFLKEYGQINNFYVYPSSITKLANAAALSFVNLERLKLKPFEQTIEYKEALDIVSSFIKTTFGKDAYQIFKNNFINNKGHVLLSNFNLNGECTLTKEELFISLPNTHNMILVGQLGHEAGHIRKMLLNPAPSYQCILGEFESFSYEIRLILWMIKEGIYVNDAISYLLTLMDLLEKSMMTRYFNNKYKLWKIKDSRVFEKRAHELDLLNIMGLENLQSLFDYIVGILTNDYIMYFYSFISVVNELENEGFLKTYNNIIENVGNVDSRVLARRNNINMTSLENYMKIRGDLISKLK